MRCLRHPLCPATSRFRPVTLEVCGRGALQTWAHNFAWATSEGTVMGKMNGQPLQLNLRTDLVGLGSWSTTISAPLICRGFPLRSFVWLGRNAE